MKGQDLADKFNQSAVEITKKLSGLNLNKKRRLVDNIVVFMGAAGGVGTSTIVANLAYKLRERKLSVLILDMSVMYPSQHNYFDIKQSSYKGDLVSFLSGRVPMGDAIESKDDIFLMMASNRSIIDKVSVDTKSSSDILYDALERLKSLFDIILIDCSHHDIEQDIVNTALFMADAMYIVWDENIACIGNSHKIQSNCSVTGVDTSQKMHVIINKRTDVAYPTNIIEKLGTNLISILPYDKAIIKCGLDGKVFRESGASFSSESAKFCSEIDKLTDKIIREAGYRK